MVKFYLRPQAAITLCSATIFSILSVEVGASVKKVNTVTNVLPPVGQALEITQLLNNLQLVDLGAKGVQQIQNQAQQIQYQIQEIQHQVQMYQNMVQNTSRLPDNVWGNATEDLRNLTNLVNQGQALSFSMGNINEAFQQRFPSYNALKNKGDIDYPSQYQLWSDTTRDTTQATLRAANLTSEHFKNEQTTLATLRAQGNSAQGQMQALQVGNQIAGQQIEQLQKLRGLVAQNTILMANWQQKEQSEKDFDQVRREAFFKPYKPSTTGGETIDDWMRPLLK
jgi:P-type conjugative transfer protein TrbJ